MASPTQVVAEASVPPRALAARTGAEVQLQSVDLEVRAEPAAGAPSVSLALAERTVAEVQLLSAEPGARVLVAPEAAAWPVWAPSRAEVVVAWFAGVGAEPTPGVLVVAAEASKALPVRASAAVEVQAVSAAGMVATPRVMSSEAVA
jgi:hypothetical protein